MDVVACAVTFGTVIAQLALVTFKLKRFWDGIADVPDTLRELLAEIELIGLLFAEMEASIKDPTLPGLPLSFWTGPLMQLSLNRAKRALLALTDLTKDLNDHVLSTRNGLKRKLVTLRRLSDKDKIKKLEERLSRSVDLLWKSYDLASKRLEAEILHHRIQEYAVKTEATYRGLPVLVSHTSGQSNEDSTKSLSQNTSLLQKRETGVRSQTKSFSTNCRQVANLSSLKTQKRASYRWRLPLWWSTTVWELFSAPQPGWDYSLRIYNIVSESSAIVKSIKAGDAAAVAELFRSKKASPFDRDQDNISLLSLCFITKSSTSTTDRQKTTYPFPSLEICKVLLEWGLSEAVHESTVDHMSPFRFASLLSVNQPDPIPEFRELLELLWSYEPDIDGFCEALAPSETLVDGRLPEFHDYSLQYKLSRVRAAAYDIGAGAFINPTWIKKNGEVLSTHVSQSVTDGNSLVHSAALNVGRDASRKRNEAMTCTSIRPPASAANAPIEFMQAIAAVSKRNTLHHVEAVRCCYRSDIKLWRGTPLVTVLGGALYGLLVESCLFQVGSTEGLAYPTLLEQERTLMEALRAWICGLQDIGVDLLSYGQTERAILKEKESYRGCFDADALMTANWMTLPWINVVGSACNPLIPLRLVSLEVSAKPEQWQLFWVFEFEAIAREFWDMVERTPVRMPGSWVE